MQNSFSTYNLNLMEHDSRQMDSGRFSSKLKTRIPSAYRCFNRNIGQQQTGIEILKPNVNWLQNEISLRKNPSKHNDLEANNPSCDDLTICKFAIYAMELFNLNQAIHLLLDKVMLSMFGLELGP